MNRFNYIVEYDDSGKVVDFLLSTNNENLIIIDHEDNPVTALRYNGNLFTVNYIENKFARLVLNGNKEDSYDRIIELGSMLSSMLGQATIYYEAVYREEEIERKDSILEWCLDKEIRDNYITAIINNDICDNILYTNVKLCDQDVKRKVLSL